MSNFKTKEQVYKNKIYVILFLCQNQKIMSKRSSLPRVGRVARSAGRVEKLFEAKSHKSTPQSLRDSSPASREQLILKTEEQIFKNRLCHYVLMSKLKKYVFVFHDQNKKSATTLRSSAQYF